MHSFGSKQLLGLHRRPVENMPLVGDFMRGFPVHRASHSIGSMAIGPDCVPFIVPPLVRELFVCHCHGCRPNLRGGQQPEPAVWNKASMCCCVCGTTRSSEATVLALPPSHGCVGRLHVHGRLPGVITRVEIGGNFEKQASLSAPQKRGHFCMLL